MDGERGERSDACIIIGAGPAGLSCATRLVDAGFSVDVLEASPHVGGLARSFSLFGQTVDLGPHRFFSHDRIVVDHWRRFVGDDYTLVNRLTRINYRGKFFQYPIQAADALENLDWLDVAASGLSYARRRLRPIPDPKTFEEWVVNRFGDHLFRIFFKTYSEKVWGIPCSRIDADWAAQRIKGLSLLEAAKAAVFRDGGRKHKTLVDQFAYPRGGSGQVYERMTEYVRKAGGRVSLETPVERVLLDDDGRVRGVQTRDGQVRPAQHVISTMPLTTMVRSLPGVPADVQEACAKLQFRNTILVYLEVDSPNLFPDNWLYVHAPEVTHGRITNFRNWCPSLHGESRTTILCMEFWCFDGDRVWSESDESMGELAERELRRVGLFPASIPVLRRHVLRVPRSYPVYERGYTEPLSKIQAFVDGVPGLIAAGRYGAFKYNNQDHSILMGLLAATEIVTGKPQHLWAVNTDESYQESAEVRALFGEASG